MVTNPVRLTELAACAGCAAKAGAEMLASVLANLSELQTAHPPELLVGLGAPDDATVYKLSEEQAVVLTVDFFAPLVDDPYDYGAIAAANAMSDVYAMGAEVVLALNVAAFPGDLPHQSIADILRGGAEKVAEAGAVIAGGHTIIDAEPKYGLCVFGLVHPRHVLAKGGARVGDTIFLTKPLGTGLVTTAAKFDEAERSHLEAAIESMKQLNRHASHVIKQTGVHALTDVTGYGILGHGFEMATASNVCLQLSASQIPVLPGALEYAYRGITTGGGARNRKYFELKVVMHPEIPEDFAHILYDPQTSGGLMFTVPGDLAHEVEAQFARNELAVWRVGEVVPGQGITVLP